MVSPRSTARASVTQETQKTYLPLRPRIPLSLPCRREEELIVSAIHKLFPSRWQRGKERRLAKVV